MLERLANKKLRGIILRVGNITNRIVDGKFQENTALNIDGNKIVKNTTLYCESNILFILFFFLFSISFPLFTIISSFPEKIIYSSDAATSTISINIVFILPFIFPDSNIFARLVFMFSR